MTDARGPAEAGHSVRRSYVRVLVIWVIVLAALFAFQQYFS